MYFPTLASCDPIPLHGVARARPLLCGLHQNPLCFSQCWPMHLFTFLGVRTPLFVFSCVFVYFAFTYEPPSVLFWPIHLFAFVGVCTTLFAQLCLRAIFVWEGGLQVVVTYGVPLTYPTHGTISRSGGRLNLLHDRRSLLVNVPRLLKQFLLG